MVIVMISCIGSIFALSTWQGILPSCSLLIHLIPITILMIVAALLFNGKCSSILDIINVTGSDSSAHYMESKEYVATLAHEVRTPLNALLGCCSLLRETNLTDQQLKYIALIQSSATQIESNVTSVLELSRLESGKVILNPKPFQVMELLQSCVDMVHPMAAIKNLSVHIRVSTEDKKIRVIGDAARICQVILNLLSNAIKFTESGFVELGCRVHVSCENHMALLRLEVLDSGPGLTPEQQSKLFQPFEQVHVGTWSKHGGSGLGLVICQKLIDLMGGRIGVVSERTMPLQGTCMYVEIALPLDGEPLIDLHYGQTIPNNSLKSSLKLAPKEDSVDSCLSAKNLLCGAYPNDSLSQRSSTSFQISDSVLDSPSDPTIPMENFLKLPHQVHEEGVTRSLKDSSVLIVDDNYINSVVVTELMYSIGFGEVLSAHSGEAAIASYEKNPKITVIMMDLNMPEMDGLQTTKCIRQIELSKKLPHPIIVGWSGSMDSITNGLCRQAGMDACLSKPANRSHIIELLNSILFLNVVPQRSFSFCLSTSPPSEV
eukprot:NODE_293_length_3011_cov_35.021122_g254_i0.p1 GENE.NODE_293_length_3011_cov_35.021122_g254_i0~~NODE_293_length_3011_cov_35.021122_g254_i0.p1  ORF type:complete len:599 (+),score=82.94 NODE_293_length_3011_cov_35.021122_g254_i0:163-1797(+)